MPRAVILTALSVEYLAVRAHLSDLREEVHPQRTVYERGQFLAEGQSWDVGIVEVGPGNSGAAVEAERAIGYFNPDVIFFVGVAGGIKDVTIGDVVAATEVYSYEFGKAGETFQTRPKSRSVDYGLEQRARAEARKGDWLQRLARVPDPAPKVFVGPIAAGAKVIVSQHSEVFQLLRSHYEDAIAVEMEGFGFLAAMRGHKQVDAIVIRGISDLIDGKAQADRAGNQATAANHASAFAFEILSKLEVDSKGYGSDSQPSTEFLQLNQEDLNSLAEILRRSGRVDTIYARRALCISSQLDPSKINFIEGGAPRDFAIQLVFWLYESRQIPSLCGLCKEIAPGLPGFQAELNSIVRKLNCG